MASACVNNTSLGNFFDSPSHDWFNPRSSSKIDGAENKSSEDFEFQLEDSVKMLPADELFSDGKLMPLLNIQTNRLNVVSSSSSSSDEEHGLKSSISYEKSKILTGMGDPYLFSPKAPRCASGWRELLGLKKLQQQSSKLDSVSKTSSKNQNPTSLKHFRYRNPKSDPSLGLPLLEETDSDRVELPRVSLDSQKSHPSVKRQHNHPPKVRLARRVQDSSNCNNNTTATTTSTISASASAMGVSMDSPRMNSSGKVVFQSLERSSSSPSTFNGGPRIKYKGMERRSYSANVSVTPVLNLNVPVGSLRGSSKFGLGQLFPSHKKGGGGGTSADLLDKMRSGQVSKQKPSS